MTRQITWVLLLIAALAGNTFALELNRNFTDNMVLQRDKPLVIRGTADKGADVTVAFAPSTGSGQAGQTKTGKADDAGVWSVTLDPLAASAKGAKLTASGKGKTAEIKDVVVGDVFLHARQTSIDISLGRDETGKKVAAANKPNPMFRAISIKAILSGKPLSDLAPESTSGWTVVAKESALKMTASAYYLGNDLAKDADVPIGIIDINMGPAFANSWLSREALLQLDTFHGDNGFARQLETYGKILAAEEQGVPYGKKDKEPPSNTLKDPLFPSASYNGTLHPLAGIAFKSVVLQLGNDYPYMRYQEILDSDNPTDREVLSAAYKYVYNLRKNGFRWESKVVPYVTREWRKALGDEQLPFGLIVPPGSDLYTFAKHHREMRELQRWVAEENPNVGIILPGTEHTQLSAQPADEKLLGMRTRSWVEGAVYAKTHVPATGPMFDHFEADFNEATIFFKEGTAQGLTAKGDALDYFEAANVEGEYYPVKAEIDGDTIRIESAEVARIVRVRYNWTDRPNQELVNAAGLPAIPFRTERVEYEWFFKNEEVDFPEEYSLPANEWKKRDITLINANLERGKKAYGNFHSWFGPAGFQGGPFGPNIAVGEVLDGSPADGKLLYGDIIYSANGKMVGEQSWLVMAEAITESETRKAGGKLVLGLRRSGENIEVELTLPVMGTYSSTAPYDCPKTEKIVANLAKLIEKDGGIDAGRGGTDFLGSDSLFMLGTGNPENLGFARRTVYQQMAKTKILEEIDPTKCGTWYPAWNSLLLGEYYMATGDRNVLPHLKYYCDQLAATQHPLGAWRHKFPGGASYGLMPALGEAAAIGFHLANDAGLDISQEAYRKVLGYFHDGTGEMGHIHYGVGAGKRPGPPVFDPETMQNGGMRTHNGALGSAAVLYDLEGDTKTAHLNSLICNYAFNNTYEGHGGNFWNNFWTPLGAKVQGKKSFINFWKHYRWYRELGRMPDGSLLGGGKATGGYGLPLVAPRERLQILGAPPSPFEADAPESLKSALEAYWKKDYARAEKLANELIASGNVSLEDMPKVEHFARTAKEIPLSIDADIARMQRLIEGGDLWEAKTYLSGLQGILPTGDERLAAFQTKLSDVKPPPKPKKQSGSLADGEQPRKWFCLVSDNQFANPVKRDGRDLTMLVNSPYRKKVPPAEPVTANIWRINVVEDISQASENWAAPNFDDSGWLASDLPVSWRMYHTALLRTTFKVDDMKRFDALRMHAWVAHQQGTEIYLNGELIAKVNNVGKLATLQYEFKESALKHLKNGENTLAIKTRQNWRWGYGALKVYNDGFDFNLDARVKE